MKSRLITIDEASQYLRIPKNTLYKMCSKGDVLYHKMGRHNRFSIEDLDEYISNQKKGTSKKNFNKTNINLKPYIKL